MAFNSDGYIMIDFTDVDFRRTNQTIEGLYKRCVDVIGTNKFILVINANGRTPLPATCSFTNNQYVIDTVIYMFAVSSNDNLFIRRNDVPASDIIDDDSVSVDKTWSSNKIDSELDTKADTSALADYQPLLTPGTNITIDENNVISSTGGAVIDDSVIVNNKVWSSLNTVEKLAPIDTVIGNPATFNTSLELPLIACNVSFSATQAGSGEPSPSNPRAISGVSAIGLNANSTPVSVSLGEERFGGVVDLLMGVATINYGIVDLGNLSWNKYGTDKFYTTISDLKLPTTVDERIQGMLCSIYKLSIGKSLGDMSDKSFLKFNQDENFWIYDTDYTDATAFKTALQTANAQLTYELATPIEVQLTPTQLSSIIGNNTFSTDGDTITVSYRHLPIDLF